VEGPGGINEGPDVFGGYDLNADTDLAGALADALASANVDDFGFYSAQDQQQSQDQLSPGEQERMAQAAAQTAYDDVIGSSTGIAQANIAALGGFQNQSVRPGYEATSVGTGVEDFTGGGYANAPATSDLSFGAYGQQTQPSGDVLSPGEQGRVDAGGYQDVLGSNTGLAQANIANLGGFASPTAAGTPGYAQPVGMGQVDTYSGMPGYGTMATEMSDYAGATMGQGGVSQNIGMINAGTTQDSAGTVSPSGAGMINTGSVAGYDDTMTGPTTYGEMDEGTLDPNAGGVSAPAAYQDKIVRDAARPPEEVTQLKKGTPEYHAAQKLHIDKSIMTMSEGLMAKAKADPNGIAIEGTNITNQRMANAFNSLDQYSRAYAATQGGSFLGGLIEGAIPFGSAVKSIQGWLESKGMYSKQTGEDLFNLMKSAVDTGDLNQIVRELGGGGPSDEDVQGPKEIKSFIEQYPWAAELDPKYIKYLIDNPAALQDLLGEGPNNAASTPMTAPNLAANEYPPGFPGMDNLPANWQDEGYTWKDPNNPNLSYSIIA